MKIINEILTQRRLKTILKFTVHIQQSSVEIRLAKATLHFPSRFFLRYIHIIISNALYRSQLSLNTKIQIILIETIENQKLVIVVLDCHHLYGLYKCIIPETMPNRCLFHSKGRVIYISLAFEKKKKTDKSWSAIYPVSQVNDLLSLDSYPLEIRQDSGREKM